MSVGQANRLGGSNGLLKVIAKYGEYGAQQECEPGSVSRPSSHGTLVSLCGCCLLTGRSPAHHFISSNYTTHSLRSGPTAAGFPVSPCGRESTPSSILTSWLRTGETTWAGAGSPSDSRNTSSSHGASTELSSGCGAPAGADTGRFPAAFPCPEFCCGGFTGSWLTGSVPAAPVRNGTWRACPLEKVSHLFTLRG